MTQRAFRVVIAGRPNVGKSALFNRLYKRRRALVHDLPGMTRDVLEVDAHLPDDRPFRLIDTGGYDPSGKEKMPAAIREKAVAAIRGADLVLLVMDASAGVLPGDRSAARIIREAGRDCVVVANKIDRKEGSEGEPEAWALGFPEIFGVSAEHGLGVDDVQHAIGERLELASEQPEQSAPDGGLPEIAVAVVGRPNVGKSSLLNALLGEPRAIVSEIAGTTRDSIDAILESHGRRFRLVDTAGIRRRGKTHRGPEVLSVVQARKRIEECDVALLVVDASEGPTGQDASVASYAEQAGRGLVLLANKWDVAGQREAGAGTAEQFRQALGQQIPFARYAPILLISATTGRGIAKILPTAAQVAENRHRRISTGELNRVLGRALRDKAPRTASGRTLKIFYVAQTGVAPPTFALVANREETLHFSEQRRIENLLREGADFSGAPIRILVRARSRDAAARPARSKSSRRKPGSG
ncbi:MAG: ribosome biogenesis GTPase Der [Acidobacteriota bacterium]